MSVSDVVLNYMNINLLTFRALANKLTKELSARPYPPRGVSQSSIHYWVTGETKTPNPAVFEWLSTNAQDESIRAFAANMLTAIELSMGDEIVLGR